MKELCFNGGKKILCCNENEFTVGISWQSTLKKPAAVICGKQCEISVIRKFACIMDKLLAILISSQQPIYQV